MFTTTPQFDAIRARADVSRRASVCANASWRPGMTRPATPAMGNAFGTAAIVPVYPGTLGFPTTDAKHIGRRPGVASP